MGAYCVKCKAKQEWIESGDGQVEQTTMKNGKPAWTGKCPVCGTKMYKIGANK